MRKFFVPLLTLILCAAGALQANATIPETPALLDRAKSLFDYGRWSDARHEFLHARTVLDLADAFAREYADFYLAACAVELGSVDAEAALRRFGEQYPGSVFDNDARFSLGSYYCAAGDMKRAGETLRQIDYKRLSPSRREQYDIRMGYVTFAEKDYDAAYDYFDRIGSGSEYADHARYYKSYIDYSRGQYGRAKQGFEVLAKSDAYRDLMPFYLLQIEFKEGNYRYVTQHGEELLKRAAPQSRLDVERVIAESWFRLDDFTKAVAYITAYQKGGGGMGRDEEYLLGFSLYRLARYGEAADHLRLACGGDDALTQNASYHLADCYLRNADKQAAMQAFAMASNEVFDPTVAEDALFNYGKLQYELGGGVFNEAINVLSRYLSKYPSSQRAPVARELLIAAYYNSNNYDAAYGALKEWQTNDPDLKAALQKITYFRGLEAYTRGDRDAAKRSLVESASIGVSPKYSSLASFWQGEIAFAEGDYPVAEAKYNAYLKRAPRIESEYAMALYNLGYSAFAREDMGRAGESFSKFLSVYTPQDSYRADALNRLGDTRYAARNFAEAVRDYEKAAALSTDERYYAQYKRAVTLGILGKNDLKQQALQQIVAQGKGDYLDDAVYELGRNQIAQERYAEGAKVLERFIADYPSSPFRPQALSGLGLAYLNLGDKQKSLKYYDMVVSASPRSAEARDAMQGIRDIYVSQGDVDAYFDYAAKAGVESDLTALSRDSLSFAAAQKLYLDGQRDAAAKSLRSYVKSYPKGYYLDDALYYLSDCYLQAGDRDAAIESLAALAEQGQSQYAVTVLDKLAELTFAEKRYSEAALAYRRFYDVAPTAADRQRAMTGYVRATLAEGDSAKIAAMAVDVAMHPDAGEVAMRESQFAHAEQHRMAGRMSDAVALYKPLTKEVKTKEGAASAYYVIEDLFAANELDKAEKAVFAFSDKKSPQAHWLAKSFLLLGDIYARKGDNFQARATYQSIADGYSPADDGIVAEAKERIAKLK